MHSNLFVVQTLVVKVLEDRKELVVQCIDDVARCGEKAEALG